MRAVPPRRGGPRLAAHRVGARDHDRTIADRDIALDGDRIAEALGINLADLFTQQTSAGRVTRLGRHPAIQSAGYRKILLTPPPLQAIEGYRLEFDEGEGTGDEPYTHGDAQEIVTVIDGTAEVRQADAGGLRLWLGTRVPAARVLGA